jgi:hypothetical protein
MGKLGEKNVYVRKAIREILPAGWPEPEPNRLVTQYQ